MNNLYHWHDEVMVDLERREIDREIAQANLLREAGLTGTDWLTRTRKGLVKLFRAKDRDPQDQRPTEQQAYRSRSGKAVE